MLFMHCPSFSKFNFFTAFCKWAWNIVNVQWSENIASIDNDERKKISHHQYETQGKSTDVENYMFCAEA